MTIGITIPAASPYGNGRIICTNMDPPTPPKRSKSMTEIIVPALANHITPVHQLLQ